MYYEESYPGQVKVTRCLKGKNILDKGKSKKIKYYTIDEFLPLLIVGK